MSNFIGGLVALFASVTLTLAPVQESQELIQLRSFLDGKGSPLPAEVLIQYPNWKTIAALACAESGYGKNLAGEYNAWGIKDYRVGSAKFGKTRNFESWEESIAYTSELLYKYDPEDGEPSPWGMVRSWKYVYPYTHWVNNVSYALYDIEQNVLVA